MSHKWNFRLPAGQGSYARQAHADIPYDTFEREIGRDGFMGPAAHIYHRNSPTAFETVSSNLAPRAFNPMALASDVANPWDAVEMFRNRCAKIRFWRTRGSMEHLVRNADGDELLFIHNGEGGLYCDLGRLGFKNGDYILLPKGTSGGLRPAVRPTSFSSSLQVRPTVSRTGGISAAMLPLIQAFSPFLKSTTSFWRSRVGLVGNYRSNASGGLVVSPSHSTHSTLSDGRGRLCLGRHPLRPVRQSIETRGSRRPPSGGAARRRRHFTSVLTKGSECTL